MTFGTGGGEVRRCDATCHSAKRPRCVCICGGRYHGKGEGAELDHAITEFTVETFGCYGKELADRLTELIHTDEVKARLAQATLF